MAGADGKAKRVSGSPSGVVAANSGDISEGKRGEKGPREAEERYRVWLEDSSDLVAVVNGAGIFEFHSPSSGPIVGYRPEELVGRSVFAFIHPEDVSPAQLRFARLAQGKPDPTGSTELRFRHKNGSWRVLEVKARSLLEEAGKVSYVLNSRDITERKQGEELLRLTQFSLDHAADCVIRLGPTGRVLYVSDSTCLRLGYPRADLLTMSVFDFALDEPRETWRLHMQEVKEAGGLTFEKRFRAKDGEVFPVEVSAYHFEYQGEEYICAFVRDIGERKRIEAELAKSERHFRSLIERAADAIYVVSRDEGMIVACNEQASKDTGYSRDELLGMCASDTEVSLGGDEVEALHLSLRPGAACTVEGVHKRKDGSAFPVEIRLALMEEGEPQLILSIIRDITERKKTEEGLRLTQLSVDQAEDLIHWVGPDGRILFANEASCRRDGYSREELLAMTIFDLDPKLSPESWPEAWRTLKEAGSRSIESLHRTKAGEIYPVEVSANYVEQGGKEYDFVFARDISERKRAEEALREGEVRYRVLVDTTSDLIYSYDTALKLTGINRAAAQTLGLEPHEATGKSMDELGFAEQTLSLWKRMTQEVLDSEAPVREVVEVVMPDGETHAYESVLEPVFTGTGEIGGLRGASRDITERGRLEQSLKLTQFSVDHAADMISWMTPGGRFVNANDTICRRLGYEREELVGLTIYDVDPQAPRPWDDHWQELKRRGSLTFETVHRTKTGEILPVEVTANYVEYEGQEYNLSFARDIIDRMRVEAQLRESEERFRGIFEQGSVGIALIDSDQRFVRANSTFCAMLGYREDELIEMSIREVTAKEDVEHSLKDTGALYSGTRALLSMDKRYLRKDGELIWGHVSAALVRGKDGAPIGTVAMVQDITERKRAEEALRESEAKTRSILNNIGSGVALISPQMEILELNHQMREWFPHVNPVQHATCYRAFNNPPRVAVCDYCPTQKTLQDGLVHEATTHTPQGDTVRNFRVVSSPILSASGEVTAAIEMVEDITDKLSLESQLRQSQKMEAVGQLAGGIAHDFNNLLTAIIGNSSLALASLAPEDPNRELIGDIKETGERAAGLTRQILAFSRRQILKPQILQLNDILLSIGPLLRRTLGEDVDLHFSLAPDLKETEVDPHQMGQVLMNLALNARDAMPEGGSLAIETANVRLERTYARAHPEVEPGRYVMLAVSDTGCGMEEETKSHIFEPFFTTKEVGKGTGLGLSTVFGIVKQSGGFISVYSEPGKGSTFKVYLPISHTAVAPEADSPEEGEEKSGSETILVVEDEAPVREVVTRILSRSGYTVLEAGSAREVDAVLKRDGPVPDLLLTDVVLPGGRSGREVAEVLLARYPGLPVVFMSGYTRDSVVHNGRLDEGIEFLEKPFTPKKLLQKVRLVLDACPQRAT